MLTGAAPLCHMWCNGTVQQLVNKDSRASKGLPLTHFWDILGQLMTFAMC